MIDFDTWLYSNLDEITHLWVTLGNPLSLRIFAQRMWDMQSEVQEC